MADLAAYLAQAYDHSASQALAADCAAAIPRAEMTAKLQELRPVLRRCHVSRVHAAFLERVLALQDA